MMIFTPEQRTALVQCFGLSFADALPAKLAKYAAQWDLTGFQLIEYYSVNCLLYCRAKRYGDCVLKIFGCEYEWYIDEIRVLSELDGGYGYVRAYERDEDGGALLLERIRPGTTLKSEPSLEKRLTVFIDAWQNARVTPRDASLFRTYLKTAEDAAKLRLDSVAYPELRRIAPIMVSVCADLYDHYPARVLLHADLHGDNLLRDTTGSYKIVDPHARIGPPICDLGRFIANEYADAEEKNRADTTDLVISRLSERLSLPKADVARAFFVDIALMTCWDAEDGAADPEGVLFAETLLP